MIIRPRKLTRAALAIALVAGVVGAWWLASDEGTLAKITGAVAGKPVAPTVIQTQVICDESVNPAIAPPTDCIPQHLAEAGKLTPDGICQGVPCDVKKNPKVLRDDVRHLIAEWDHSRVAVERLTTVALQYQRAVHYSDSLGKDETRRRFADEMARESACAFQLETQETRDAGARKRVQEQVLNTKERRKRAEDFGMMFANSVISAFEGTASQACGFDVEALVAKEGKQTIASQLIAEADARAKREQEEEAIERAKEQK